MLVQSMFHPGVEGFHPGVEGFHPGVEGHILLYFETTWIQPSYRRVISIKVAVAIAQNY